MKPPILVCAQSLGPNLSARAVGAAIARGLGRAGMNDPDVVELSAGQGSATLNPRIRAAFAVVICDEHLAARDFGATLSAAIATDARQAGVACHAICSRNDLDLFTARIYDLQTIRTVSSEEELVGAAEALSAEL